MARGIHGTLSNPDGSVVLADFTNGSVPNAQIVTDSGFPNASGRSYSVSSAGIKMSITGGITAQYASVRWEPGGTIDLSKVEWIGIEVEVPEDSNGGLLNSVGIFIGQESGNTFTNYRNISRKNGVKLTPARQIVIARMSGETWTVTGSPNMSQIRKIDIRTVIHADAQNIPAYIYVRKIHIGRNRPKVIFSFDDGMDGQINHALPELSAAGMKAALALSPHIVGNAGRLTEANLQSLYDAGWDFGCQQYNDTGDTPLVYAGVSGLTSNGSGTATFAAASNIPHGLSAGMFVDITGAVNPAYNGNVCIVSTPTSSSFTYTIQGTPVSPDTGRPTCRRLTDAQIIESWTKTIEWISSRGWTRGNTFAAYSGGVFNDLVIQLMMGIGFKMVRTTSSSSAPWRGFDPRVSDLTSMMHLPGFLMDGQTASTVLSYVDSFISYGTTGILYGHDIDATPATGTITLSEWQGIVRGVKQRRDLGLIDVVTPTEFLSQLTSPRAIL